MRPRPRSRSTHSIKGTVAAASRLWERGNKLSRVLGQRRDTSDNEKWSGRWESNPRLKLGKLGYYHYTTPALLPILVAFQNLWQIDSGRARHAAKEDFYQRQTLKLPVESRWLSANPCGGGLAPLQRTSAMTKGLVPVCTVAMLSGTSEPSAATAYCDTVLSVMLTT